MVSVSYNGRMWSVVKVKGDTLTLALATDKSKQVTVKLSSLPVEVQNYYKR